MNNAKDILEWYVLAGVDEAFGNIPFGLEEKEPKNSRIATTNIAAASVDAKALSQKLCLQAQTLAELNQHIQDFEGCSLKFTATNTVLGAGNESAKTMVVIDAPSADDDRTGKILMTKSGELINAILKAMQIDASDCYFTTLLPWRPPGNRIPTPAEIAICLPFLKKQIELINPDKIMIFGIDVIQALLNTNDSITKLREQKLQYTNYNANKIELIPSFSINYLLMNPIQKAKIWENTINL